jgi:branched-chain amino acid transport system ATP-binding protein
MTGNGSLVRIEDLVGGYGKKEILHQICITIGRGKIATLIGRNGVGKTTLLKTVMGFLKPKRGKIFFEDKDISALKTHVLATMGISYVPQGKAVFPHMNIAEHLDVGAWIRDDSEKVKTTLDMVYHLFPRLYERKHQSAGTLSGGERQMLSIGRALMSAPTLLLLDEPSFGLSPIIINAVFESIREINLEGVTIFLVEQNAKKALENSDIGYVMDMGNITFEGKSEDLLHDNNVRMSYLGGKGE